MQTLYGVEAIKAWWKQRYNVLSPVILADMKREFIDCCDDDPSTAEYIRGTTEREFITTLFYNRDGNLLEDYDFDDNGKTYAALCDRYNLEEY